MESNFSVNLGKRPLELEDDILVESAMTARVTKRSRNGSDSDEKSVQLGVLVNEEFGTEIIQQPKKSKI